VFIIIYIFITQTKIPNFLDCFKFNLHGIKINSMANIIEWLLFLPSFLKINIM